MCALLASITVSAASTTPGLYASKDEATKALDTVQVPGSCTDYSSCLASALKAANPTKKCDYWTYDGGSAVSIYYEDSTSSKGYGTVYQIGKSTRTGTLAGYSNAVCKEKYDGDGTGANGSNVTANTTSTTSTGTCTGPNCPQSTTASSSVSNCPTCPKAAAQITNVSVNSSLTDEQQKKLENFMTYFNGKESVTTQGIRDQAIKCFLSGGQ
jgi:hypothetical protein